MSKEDTHRSLSLPIDITEQDLADQVASELNISIDIRFPFWAGQGGTENPTDNMIGVYCENEEKAELFQRAFEQRHWENRKGPRGE